MPGPPPPPQREEVDRVLNVRIVEAKDVIADDESANLFCRVMLTNPRDKKFLPKTTGILKRTNRPVWNQDFSFLFRGASSLVVGVYGYHRLSKAVLLGRCAVEVQPTPKQDGEIVGTWFELYDRAFERKTGSTIFLRHYVQDLQENTGALALGGFENEAFVLSRARALNYRPSELEPPESLLIFCATFNLGSEPLPVDLKPWIPEDDFDVFAIGAQEAVFPVGKDMMGKPKFHSCGAEWRSRLTQHFGNRYSMITSTSTRGGIRLVVFVRTKLAHLISLVDSSSVITTFNKGAAAISFFYKHTSFAFVNCHLTAHQNKTNARNAEVRHLMRSLKLKTTAPPQLDALRQFHHVFWMGDLNYRLNFGDQGDALSPSETQFSTMVQKIQAGNLDELFACDQLQTEMHEGRVFAEFQESKPQFAPTFKVERCFPVVYTKQRSPAWCDRVLWWSAPTLQVSQLYFDSASKLSSSDHKPVSSAFSAEVWSLPPSYDDDLGPCYMFVRSLECHDLRKEDAAEDLEEPVYDNQETSVIADEKVTTYHRRTSSDDIFRSNLVSGSAQNTDVEAYDEDVPTAAIRKDSPLRSYTVCQASFSQPALPIPLAASSSSSSASLPHLNTSTSGSFSHPFVLPPPSSPLSSPALSPAASLSAQWRLSSPVKDDGEKPKKASTKPSKKLFRMLRKEKSDIERFTDTSLKDKHDKKTGSFEEKSEKKTGSFELKATDVFTPRPRIARVGSLRTASASDILQARNTRSGSMTSGSTDLSRGSLNPYVKFRSHVLLKSFSTPLRKKSQGMLWDASDFVEPLPFTVNNPHRLLREYLSVKVCHNPGGTNKFKVKKKVPIGSALIPLALSKEFMQQQRASQEGLACIFPFDVNLVRSGVIKGRLAGVLELQWGPPGDRRQPGQATSKRPAPTGKEKKFITKQGLKVTHPGFSRPSSDIDDDDLNGVASNNLNSPDTVGVEAFAVAGNWHALRDSQGRVYFYNAKTHVSTWEQPSDFVGVLGEPELVTTIHGWQVLRVSGKLCYMTNAQTPTHEVPAELVGVPELTALLAAEKGPEKISRDRNSLEIPRTNEHLPSPPPLRRCSACSTEVKPSCADCPTCGHVMDEPLLPLTRVPVLRPSSLKLRPSLTSPSSVTGQEPLTPIHRIPVIESRPRGLTEFDKLQQRKEKVLADAYLQIQMPDVLSATEFDDENLSDSD